MLARHRNYLLKDTKQLHAHVQVIPTGKIEVEIVEKHQRHAAEFEHLRFERSGRVTKLVGKHTSNGKPIHWQLPLANDDAKELEHLIEEAAEELEILMRDL
ncbi:hypothetical protein A1OO_18755 [Enterovibrio norvegicus FF-33]|uniref:hypothetical protein n=1 Tax=Enterovibrio norvegicus TaxID=188144 RepID=UPI00030D9523|nr:hypothetical protein [Enterovibrio norvegicus]OEE67778.1 hypothetical protein A1OO_18755 [Enterovibrio norvegicus FF-33]